MTEQGSAQLQSDRLGDFRKLLEISRSMVAAADLDSLLNLIVTCSTELLDAERASVFLYDEQTGDLLSRAAVGGGGLRLPADRGITGATVSSGMTICVPDAYADPRFNPDIDRATGFVTRSMLSMPLRGHQGELVGVLQVINKQGGPFDRDDVTLGETLAAQAGVAIQRADLIQHYTQKRQMEKAMRIAQEIQRGLLPKSPPAIEGFDISGFSLPTDETSGDTYDFLRLVDGRWMLMVADASGHGVGSALVIAETRAMLRAVALGGADLPRILRTVNDLLVSDLGQERFVTCFCGLLDPAASRLTYASAGHGPLIFYRAADDNLTQTPATDLPLGIMDGAEYRNVVDNPLSAGDFLVIITDGFLEATDPAGQAFGCGRVMDLLRRQRDRPSAEMIRALHAAVLEFTDGAPQTDDLTAMVLRRI